MFYNIFQAAWLTLISSILALPLYGSLALPLSEGTRDDEILERIKHVAALSQKARTSTEYTELIEECEALLAEEIEKEKHERYLKDLAAWASNRRGKARLELVASFREIHNDSQAEQALQSALQDFDRAVDWNPKCWKAFLNRGVAWCEKQDYEKAHQDFSEVIEQQPDSLDAWFNRAEVNYERQAYEAALADYDHVLKQSPSDLQATTGRAHTLCQLRRWDEALVEYNVVIELKPRSSWALANRADCYQEQGEWEKAHADYQQALEFEPIGPFYQRLAWMMATTPSDEYFMPQVALGLIQKAIHLDGESAGYLDTLAAAYAANGEFDRAQETQARAIETFPSATPPEWQARQALYEQEELYQQEIKRR